jgi:radical SAM superfamily enzyme YgiQ (UPF0313 family)/ubiquinone/menaquinone biosynthesis C-methylase UbiE
VAGSSWYPIFLAYATGVLEKNGHQVKLVDAPVENLSRETVLKDIENFKPDIVAIYITWDSLKNDIKMAKQIKQINKCKIVFVGPWGSAYPKEILKKVQDSVNAIITREFEYPLLEMAEGKDFSLIGDVVWKKNKEIIENPNGPIMNEKQLNEIPFVTSVYKNHLNIKKYRQASLLHPFVDLFTARGCSWGKCTFCLWPHTIHCNIPYRMRDIENVIKELKFVKKELPSVKEIFIQDDTLPAGRMKQLAEAILKNNLKIIWSGYCRPDIDYKTLKLAKKSGCRLFHVGYESANQTILNNVNKGVTVEQMEKFTKDAKKAGLKIHGDFIVGLPGETKETILKTLNWAKKINISDYQFVIPQPHPGTPLYQWVLQNKYLNKQGRMSYPGLTADDLEHWRFYIYRKLYLSPRYLFSHIIKSFKEPREFLRLIYLAWKGLPKLFRSKRIKKITDHRERRKITQDDIKKQSELEKKLKNILKTKSDAENFNKVYNEFHKYILEHGYATEGRKEDEALHAPENYFNLSEELIYKLMPLNKKILDIGIGDGRLCLRLAKDKKNDVYGVDVSDYSIKIAKTKKEPDLNLHFQKADARKLPFPNNYFDSATSKDLLEHLPAKDHLKHLNEVKRVLKPNGNYLLYTPPLLAYKKLEGLHLKQYKTKDLYKLLKSVFKKVEIYNVHLTFFNLKVKIPKPVLQLVYMYDWFLEKTRLYVLINPLNKFLIFRGLFKATK